MKTLFNTKTTTLILILGIIFLIIALSLIGNGLNTSNNNLMALSTFMFGIFVAFAISNAHSKIRQINEAIKAEEGNTLFIYKSINLWNEETKQKVQKLIDKYLIDQIDYYLWDFKYSSKSFMKLYDFILQLESKNDSQKTVYANMISTLADSFKQRKQVEALVTERMSYTEWLSVLLLLLVNIIYMFNMNDGSLINIIATVSLSITSITFAFLLRDLDSLRWKESTWIWEPLQNLFKELDLVPYFADIVQSGRIKAIKGEKIRVAEYPNKYPDMTGKIIKEIEA